MSGLTARRLARATRVHGAFSLFATSAPSFSLVY